MLLFPSTLMHFQSTLGNFYQMWHKRTVNHHIYTAFANAVGCMHKPSSLTIHTILALKHVQRSDHDSTPSELPEETWGLLIALFPPIHIPYLTRQLHIQEHPSQSTLHPLNPIPHSRTTPPRWLWEACHGCPWQRGRLHCCIRSLIREISHLATLRVLHPSPPVHACMEQWDTQTNQHNQKAPSSKTSVLYPLQKKCQTRVTQLSKP